jgi:hypothetical protein
MISSSCFVLLRTGRMGFHGDSSVPEEGGIGLSFIPVESVRIEVRCACTC